MLECVERHIVSYGVSEFIVGHYGAFDSMAATAVHERKSKHTNIKLTLLLPYHPSNRKDDGIGSLFGGTLYPFDKPVLLRYAIVKANEYVINRVDYLVCYETHVGKSRGFLECAQRDLNNVKLICFFSGGLFYGQWLVIG